MNSQGMQYRRPLRIAAPILLYVAILFFAANSIAQSRTALVNAIESELAQLPNAHRVYYESLFQRNPLMVQLHNEAVFTNDSEMYIVALLDEVLRTNLVQLGYVVQPALEYQAQRKAVLEKQLNDVRGSPAVLPAQFGDTVLAVSSQPSREPTPAFSVSGATIADSPCFPTVEESFAIIQGWEHQYPNLATLIDIGDSWEKLNGLGGYDLLVMKITNNAIVGDKPVLFIHSAMHAREWATAPLSLSFAELLLSGYGHDADITWILDHHEVHILFYMNPDGRKIAEQRVLKRKNNNTAHCSSGGGELGVDLNRNFGFFWRVSEGVYSFPQYRTSDNPCAETFRGPSAASEPETQAVETYIRSLFSDSRGSDDSDPAPLDKQGLHIDIHSSGGLILYPYSHTPNLAPNETQMATLARKLAFFNNYNPQPTDDLYLLDGNSEGVSYGELGVPQLTFEIGTQFFESCEVFTQTVEPDNLKSLLYAAKIVSAPYQLPGGPDIEEVLAIGDSVGRVNLGETHRLQVTARDDRYRRYYNSLGQVINEPTQAIIAVEYAVDEIPGMPSVAATLMQPVDGTFDSVLEHAALDYTVNQLQPGRHSLFFRALDASGQWGATTAMFFEVKNPLQAQFASLCDHNTCRFWGDQSVHYGGTISRYEWDFGNGQQSSEVNPEGIIYSTVDSQSVTLTVYDDSGLSDTVTALVSPFFLGQPPIPSVQIECEELRCRLDASASHDSDGAIVDYEWRLPSQVASQAAGATDAELTLSFSNYGSYRVELVLTDDRQLKAIETLSLQLTAPEQPQSTSSGGGGAVSMNILLMMLMRLLSSVYGSANRTTS